MKLALGRLGAAAGLLIAGAANAQPPAAPADGPGDDRVAASIERMMSLDADGDGALSREEVADSRLQALFGRADGDGDGVVSRDELLGEFRQASQRSGRGRRGGPGGTGPGGGPGGEGFGPGGPGGGPGGFGPGGPGGFGPGGPGGPPRFGQIMPRFLIQVLGLNETQAEQLAELQREVDAKLAEILTPEQRERLSQMAPRGPGGPPGDRPGGGPERGPGGFEPGAGPPGGPGDDGGRRRERRRDRRQDRRGPGE